MDFAYLEKAHHGLCIAIDNAKKEAEEGKNLANNALAGIVFHASSYIERANKFTVSYGTLD